MMPLIAPKPLTAFTPDEYHKYVSDMYALPARKGKPASPAPGLTVNRTKRGSLSVRRAAKVRPFAYATYAEVAALASAVSTSQSDIWNLLKRKEYIIATTRMEAERLYAELKEMPW